MKWVDPRSVRARGTMGRGKGCKGADSVGRKRCAGLWGIDTREELEPYPLQLIRDKGVGGCGAKAAVLGAVACPHRDGETAAEHLCPCVRDQSRSDL